MLIGCIADDFTGASDIANTLAKGGLAAMQFNGVPAGRAPAGCQAGIVSLKTRSVAAVDAVAQSLAALVWLREQGCRQIVFKYCSTFDSTPEGNIGPVADALADALGVKGVVVCPAFPATGRRVFQGHLFVHDRLLSESGMERHPLTPMTDPDIRRWLRRQSRSEVGFVGWDTVRHGGAAIAAGLRAAAAAGQTLVVVDAATPDDLIAIGEACDGAPLVTGGSGVAMGLAANFIRAGILRPDAPRPVSVDGPAVVVAGSCSGATRGQVEVHSRSHPAHRLDVPGVLEGAVKPEDVAQALWAERDRLPLIYSSEDPDAVAARQSANGRERVAQALEHFFGQLAVELVEIGFRRIVVAGGETSGAVVTALGAPALRIGPEIDPGIPALQLTREHEVGIALKSGNFGGPDFFARAAAALGGHA